jgi:peroxiredoxin
MDEKTSMTGKPSENTEVASAVRVLQRVIWAMMFIVALSLASNLYLAYTIRDLAANPTPKFSARAPLSVGVSAPDIIAKNLSGADEKISFKEGDKPGIIYVFSPSCIWCDRNQENLKMIVASKRATHRIIGVSLVSEGVKEYVAKHNFDFPVYVNPTHDTVKAYNLGGTPQTIVISSSGKVEQNWEGAFVGEMKSNAEKYFGIALPGISTEGH